MVIVERIPGSTAPQVLRVLATVEDWDFDEPWAKTTRESTGVGVVIGPRLVLTLASVVVGAVEPTVPLAPHQARAQIKAIDHDRDLALLELADSITAVWGIEPAALGPMPVTTDVLILIGHDEDARAAEIGHAVISKIGLTRYAHSQRHLLAVTFEARQPLHVGGDAVFRNGALIGLVMQRSTDDDQRGELIPPPLIQAFLDGVTAGKPTGVPALGIAVQPLDHPAARALVGLGAGEPGALVTRVDHGGTCDGVLLPRDVLISIDGQLVATDGSVLYREQPLKHYAVLGTRHLGDQITLAIRRGGKDMAVQVTLGPWLPLVYRARHDVPPTYLVFAGLVFQPVTRDYLTTWESWWDKGPKEFLNAYYWGERTAARRELVALTSVLEDPINAGYATFANESVVRVGEHVPRDLEDLGRLLDAAHGLVTIELSSGALIVLDADEARAATPRILADHGVLRDRA